MMYPLVRELAAKDAPIRVPVTVMCRVLKIARQPYYRWLAHPVTDKHGVIRHEFNANTVNKLWLTDITEHRTAEGKLYLCAIKDVYPNRIVGYSIDSRMKSRLAVTALNNAVARRRIEGGDVAGCVIHSDRGPSSPRTTP